MYFSTNFQQLFIDKLLLKCQWCQSKFNNYILLRITLTNYYVTVMFKYFRSTKYTLLCTCIHDRKTNINNNNSRSHKAIKLINHIAV